MSAAWFYAAVVTVKPTPHNSYGFSEKITLKDSRLFATEEYASLFTRVTDTVHKRQGLKQGFKPSAVSDQLKTDTARGRI